MVAPLTPEEEKELAQYEAEQAAPLTPEEEEELAQYEKEAEANKPSVSESALRGLKEGVFAIPNIAASVLGGDSPTKMVEAAGRTIFNDKDYSENYYDVEKAEKAAQEENPLAYLAGELAPVVPAIGSLAAKGIVKGAKALPGAAKTAAGGVKSVFSAGDKVITKVANKIDIPAEAIKDVGALAIDYFGAGGFASGARILMRASSKILKSSPETEKVLEATTKIVGSEAKAIETLKELAPIIANKSIEEKLIEKGVAAAKAAELVEDNKAIIGKLHKELKKPIKAAGKAVKDPAPRIDSKIDDLADEILKKKRVKNKGMTKEEMDAYLKKGGKIDKSEAVNYGDL